MHRAGRGWFVSQMSVGGTVDFSRYGCVVAVIPLFLGSFPCFWHLTEPLRVTFLGVLSFINGCIPRDLIPSIQLNYLLT